MWILCKAHRTAVYALYKCLLLLLLSVFLRSCCFPPWKTLNTNMRKASIDHSFSAPNYNFFPNNTAPQGNSRWTPCSLFIDYHITFKTRILTSKYQFPFNTPEDSNNYMWVKLSQDVPRTLNCNGLLHLILLHDLNLVWLRGEGDI